MNKDFIRYGMLAVLGALVYYEFIRGTPSFAVGSVGTPNAIAVPTTPAAPSVSSGSSVLTPAETGVNLFSGSGLGNNPVPVPTVPSPVILPKVSIVRAPLGTTTKATPKPVTVAAKPAAVSKPATLVRAPVKLQYPTPVRLARNVGTARELNR